MSCGSRQLPKQGRPRPADSAASTALSGRRSACRRARGRAASRRGYRRGSPRAAAVRARRWRCARRPRLASNAWASVFRAAACRRSSCVPQGFFHQQRDDGVQVVFGHALHLAVQLFRASPSGVRGWHLFRPRVQDQSHDVTSLHTGREPAKTPANQAPMMPENISAPPRAAGTGLRFRPTPTTKAGKKEVSGSRVSEAGSGRQSRAQSI